MTVDDYLNVVDYSDDPNYVPSDFALHYLAFIKMVNGAEGEENKTPVIHLKMLDTLIKEQDTANLLFRGAAKALSLDTQILTPLGNKTVEELSVGDSVFDRSGKVTFVLAKSEVFNKPMYELVLADGRKLKVSEDHINIVRKRTSVSHGSRLEFKEYELTTKELLEKGVTYNRTVSDRNPSGQENKWFIPTASAIELCEIDSPIDPYTVGLILGDGSIGETGYSRIHCHVDDVNHYLQRIPYTCSEIKEDIRYPQVKRFGILGIGKKVKSFLGVDNCYSKRVPQALLWGSKEQRLAVLQGLMDTDGTVGDKKSSTTFTSVSEGLANDVLWLVRSLGGEGVIKTNLWNGRLSYRVHIRIGINPFTLPRKANKWVANVKGHVAIIAINKIEDAPSQCLMVSSGTKSFLAESFIVTHNTTVFGEYMFPYLAVYGELPGLKVDVALYVTDSIENGVKNMRKNLEHRWENSAFLQEYIPSIRFTDTRWEFTNIDGRSLIVKGYGAKTGVRGAKEKGKRPQFALLDDLLSDEDARSPTVIASIEDTVYKAVDNALHPTKRKVIWNGTPFNQRDPLYKAIESGGWAVNVFPVCEKFPCTRKEFKGAWPDRFSYDAVKRAYDKAVANGKADAFNQELMLRIMSQEDKLILPSDLVWYSRELVLLNKHNFNFYITTDLATSEKKSADFSVVSVWAYNSNGDWLLVDGFRERCLVDKAIEQVFRFVQIYQPQGVGIEVSGQQGGFVTWIQNEMIRKNLWFTLTSSRNSALPGIRPVADKFSRFMTVSPLFKARKIMLPTELKEDPFLVAMVEELSLISRNGFKSKNDDTLDTISMLTEMNPWKPTNEAGMSYNPHSGLWESDDEDDGSIGSSINSYIV